MKKLIDLLIQNVIETTDKNTALYILKDIIENKWEELDEDSKKTLEKLVEDIKGQ